MPPFNQSASREKTWVAASIADAARASIAPPGFPAGR
jgi:hypothetical protein